MFSDSDRGGMLNLLLAEVDFANLPTWDDSQVSLALHVHDNFAMINYIQ